MRPFAGKLPFVSALVCLCLCVLFCGGSVKAQSALAQPDGALPSDQLPASVSGTVVDPSGAAVAGAQVTLTQEHASAKQGALTDDNGQFSFGGVAPGTFQLAIAAQGFATQSFSASLQPGENYTAPRLALALATEKTEVKVVAPTVEIAEEQLRIEEKQRVLGVVPNYYVTYIPDAAPLDAKQKFKLAFREMADPVTFAVTGAIAGAQQANDSFKGYGQGAQGYSKRYGADYANAVSDTFIGGAILPSLLKQDPRYFYKGVGSTRSRLLYAIANAVICKGDNGRWQANYSNILGSLAAGGLSNLYYPPDDRNSAALTFENAALGIGASAAANILQEFVIRKLTPSARKQAPATN